MKPKNQQLPLITTLRSRRYLILSVVSWIVIFVLSLSVVLPRIQNILEIRDKNDGLQKNLAALQDKITFLESFKSAEFSSQNEKMQRILPTTKPFLQMLSTLEQLSVQESVLFAGLDINPGVIASESAAPSDKGSDTIAHLDLQLKILGSAANINSFMDKLNTVTPAVDIQSYSTSTQKQGVGALVAADQIYEADIKLRLLYAPIAAAKTGQPLPTLSAEETEYAKTKLSNYVIFDGQNTVVPSLDQLGKDDPFAL